MYLDTVQEISEQEVALSYWPRKIPTFLAIAFVRLQERNTIEKVL